MRPSDCPDAAVWVAWQAGILAADARARHRAHLLDCGDCRAELAALAEDRRLPLAASFFRPPASRFRPLLAAAGLLLLAGGWVFLRDPAAPSVAIPDAAEPPPYVVPPAGGLAEAGDVPVEVPAGAASQVLLLPGAALRAEGALLRLERGTALLEAAGDGLRLGLRGWTGELRVTEGLVACRAEVPPEGFLRSAVAAEDAWGVRVLSGEAELLEAGGRRLLRAGEAVGLPVEARDPRTWMPIAAPDRLRDRLEILAGPPAEGARVVEMRLRKGEPRAEAALRFAAAGAGWRLPLGALLPSDGSWIRLRLEVGGRRVRLLAGVREAFVCAPAALGRFAYPDAAALPLGVQVWGGDIELRGCRWRRALP